MNKLPSATALVLAGVSAIGALSAQATNKLEEIVVTSSRVEMPLREVATSISVVTPEEIQLRGFSTVADTLRYEPAISVASNGGPGSTTAVRIRGEDGFRTRVFIDGIDITDNSSPQAGPNFGNLMSGGIDRIEILRGPEGLAYGADAGGVINMFTAAPQAGLSGGAELEGGRYDTWRYGGHVAGGNELVDGAAMVQGFETDGFNALTADAELRDDDGYENTTAHGRAGLNITNELRAELVARTVEGKNDYDNCFLPSGSRSDDCRNEYNQDFGRVALVHNGQEFANTMAYNANTADRDFYTEGLNDFSADSDFQQIDYLGNWRQSEMLGLVYGAELQRDSMNTGTGDESRDQEGYFLEYKGGFNDNIFVTAGARYTDNEDFGTKTTYRTGAVYLMTAGEGEFKIKGTYGTGFRAPSLNEIAYNDYVNSSDIPPDPLLPELGAEESKGYDAGVGYFATSGWYVDVVYFDQKIDDEIFFDPNYDPIIPTGYLQADGETESSGVEVTTEVPINEMLTLANNYTYTDTQDFEGEQRRRAPKHLGNIGLLITPWDDRLQININYRIARDIADEFGASLDDYEVLDIAASYRVLDDLQVFARVENATDEEYQDIPNYRTSEIAGYAGVRVTF